MNKEQYEKLLPYKERWQTFKVNHAMKWSALELLTFQQIHKEVFGWVNPNLYCGQCTNELVHKVFNQFEEYEAKI